MCGSRTLKSFWLIVLLIVETVQGCTPDLASIASARLLNIVAEHGAFLVSSLQGCRSRIPDALPAQPSSPDPFEDSEPDEVCLASFSSSARLAGSKARALFTARLCTADLGRPPLRSACGASADGNLAYRGSRALIVSLCRLTC
jgi:hypothetical protein